jgi:hypothetical protein
MNDQEDKAPRDPKDDVYSLGKTILTMMYMGASFDLNRDKTGDKLE